jgi:hypothetical protein
MAYTREVLERRRQRERLDAVLAGLPVEAEEEAPLELSGEIGQLTGGNSLAGLGRLRAPDPRDRQYLLQRPRSVPSHRTWYGGPILDQGGTSQCVAYAGVKYLLASPVINKAIDPEPLYRECQRVDEWPGEDYDGTSVRALFKVLKAKGYIQEYRWAFDAETVIAHVLAAGPVVVGTDWTWGMMDPDRHGYIAPEGESLGGHAWTIIGANRTRRNPDGTKGAVRMVNSWGPNWGNQNGRAWVTFGDLGKLIAAWGEACVAVEVKLGTKVKTMPLTKGKPQKSVQTSKLKVGKAGKKAGKSKNRK